MTATDGSVWESNVYRANARTGATPSRLVEHPTARDELFAQAADDVLATQAEVVRRLIPSHQSAISLVIDGDWSTARKYFSLSPKYAAWSDYSAPARGVGLHEWLFTQRSVVRMTSAEIGDHPAFRGFDGQRGHPPMPSWLAGTVRDRDDVPWGIVQLSDRADGAEYGAEDVEDLALFIRGLGQTLQALRDLRDASPV